MKRGDGGSSVVQLTTGIEDEGGGWWMNCHTFDYWDNR